MAVDHYTFTVGTSPVKIVEARTGVTVSRVYITNHDNATLYIGDASVSATSGGNWGFTIVKDASYEFELFAGDTLYAVSATSANVTVLITGA
jgi:hypothetical protein